MRTNWRASIKSFLAQSCFASNRCSSAAIRAVISGKMISTCSRRSSNRRLSPESPRFATVPFFARPPDRPRTFFRGTILLTDMVSSRLRILLLSALQTGLASDLLPSSTFHLLRFTLPERQGDFSRRNRYSLPSHVRHSRTHLELNHVLHQENNAAGCSKRPSARPQVSRNRRRTLKGYVEDFDEPRTMRRAFSASC